MKNPVFGGVFGGSVELKGGLGAEVVEQKLKEALRTGDVANRCLAFYLSEMKRRGLHRVFGMPSTVAYAVKVLGMSATRARELVRVGERLEELRGLDGALRLELVCWSKVRRIASVATAETEREWVEWAEGKSQAEVEAMVQRCEVGDTPKEVMAGGGLPIAQFKVELYFDSLGFEEWNVMIEKLRAEGGWDAEASQSDVVRELVRMGLSMAPDGTVPGRKQIDGSIYKVLVRVDETTQCVAAPDAGDVGDAAIAEPAEIAVRSATAELLLADGVRQPLDPATAELILEDSRIPPKLRAQVLARDGHACQNCDYRRWLHIHHIHWRCHGGPTRLDNLEALCAKCHGLVHDGRLLRRPRSKVPSVA